MKYRIFGYVNDVKCNGAVLMSYAIKATITTSSLFEYAFRGMSLSNDEVFSLVNFYTLRCDNKTTRKGLAHYTFTFSNIKSRNCVKQFTFEFWSDLKDESTMWHEDEIADRIIKADHIKTKYDWLSGSVSSSWYDHWMSNLVLPKINSNLVEKDDNNYYLYSTICDSIAKKIGIVIG